MDAKALKEIFFFGQLSFLYDFLLSARYVKGSKKSVGSKAGTALALRGIALTTCKLHRLMLNSDFW